MARHGRRSLSDSMIWAWAGGEGGSRLDDGGGRRGVVTSARAVRWRGRHDHTQCEAPRVTTNLGTDEALILDFVPEWVSGAGGEGSEAAAAPWTWRS